MDTGAGRTLIPERDAVKLGLEYVGDTEIVTGSGKDRIKLYEATITFLNKDFLGNLSLIVTMDLLPQTM